MKIMSIDSRNGTASYVEVADWQVGEEEAFKIGSRKLAEDSVCRDSDEIRYTGEEEEC